jgi:hypothetical protein
MKKPSKNLVRTLVLSSVLASGVMLAQSFYNEAQATGSDPCDPRPGIYPGKIPARPGQFPLCVCPLNSTETPCTCIY